MPKNTNNLPYFKVRRRTKEKTLADFLLRKFRPRIKEKFPQHFLVQPIPFKTLNFIKETSKKYPHFLRFDIRLYYPSVSHQILLKKLPEIYPVRWRLRLSHGVAGDLPREMAASPISRGKRKEAEIRKIPSR